MRKFTPSIVLAAAGLALSVGTVAPAQAAVSWHFNQGNTSHDVNFGKTGKTVSNGGVSVTATAWSATTSSNKRLEAANLWQYRSNGLGVVHDLDGSTSDTGQPQHSLDNQNRYDAVLFDFGSTSVTLDQVTAGWWTNDSDITVLAYTGNGNAVSALQNFDYNDADGADNGAAVGWDAVGNYEIGNDGDNYNEDVNSQNISSSYWLVGAYNPGYGACNDGQTCSGQGGYLDYIKLAKLTGSFGPPPPGNNVAEPSSLLLFALGMMAPVALRRRRGGNAEA